MENNDLGLSQEAAYQIKQAVSVATKDPIVALTRNRVRRSRGVEYHLYCAKTGTSDTDLKCRRLISMKTETSLVTFLSDEEKIEELFGFEAVSGRGNLCTGTVQEAKETSVT